MTTAQAEKSLEKVKKNINETNKEVKESINNFGLFGVTVGDIKNKFGELKGIASKALTVIKLQSKQAALGLRLMFGGKMKKGAKSLFTTIKAGIASTGIGLLITAIGSLVSHFTNTKKGAEQLQVAMKSIGAAFSVITDRASKLGGAIVKLFKGDVKGALEEAKGAVTGFGKEVSKEVKQIKQLAKDTVALRDSNRELNVETAKRRAEVEALKLIAEDTTKSEEVRIKSARRAFQLENEVMTTRVKNAEEALRIRQAEIDMSESSAEELDSLAQLEIDVFNIRQESTTKQIELNNKINNIEREAFARKQAERELEAEQREADFAEAEKFNEEMFKLEEERVKKEKALKLKQDKLDEELRLKEIERNKAVQDSKMQVAGEAFGAIADIYGRESMAGKGAAVAQATINTYQAATNALAMTPAPPPFPMIAAGVAVAAGLANVNKILNTDTNVKFATGGVVGGGGTGTSDSVRARLSRGESVVNARSTRMFKPLLSAINEAGGGRRFADGGIVGGDTGGMSTGTVKAFVVADDVTKTQNRLSKIRRKSTL